MIIDGEEEYEIEQIKDAQLKGKLIQYLIKWVGEPDSENLWKRPWELQNAQKSIEDFHW